MLHSPIAPALLIPLRSLVLTIAVQLVMSVATSAQSDHAHFHIQKGNKTIGQVHALKHRIGTNTNYVMTSHAEFNLGWKQVVRTHLTTEYRNDMLTACQSVIKLNDALRDSSSMARSSDRCYVYPDAPFTCDRSTQWTTARMYFQEPVGEGFIFVESALQALALISEGAGRYLLTFPNGTSNRYVYREGRLQEIHVKRPLVSLVFRRA